MSGFHAKGASATVGVVKVQLATEAPFYQVASTESYAEITRQAEPVLTMRSAPY
jgi:hypothetical protein